MKLIFKILSVPIILVIDLFTLVCTGLIFFSAFFLRPVSGIVGILGIFVLGIILSGMSLWIKCRRGITEETVKRKEELLGLHESRIWLNTGSTAYCLLCIAGMVYSLM